VISVFAGSFGTVRNYLKSHGGSIIPDDTLPRLSSDSPFPSYCSCSCLTSFTRYVNSNLERLRDYLRSSPTIISVCFLANLVLPVTDYMSDIYYLLENLFYSAPIFYAMVVIFTLSSVLAPSYLLAIRLYRYHAWPRFFYWQNRIIWLGFAAYDYGEDGKHKNISPHYVVGTWNDRFGILQSFETKASGGQSEG